jgi:hypothetical protein
MKSRLVLALAILVTFVLLLPTTLPGQSISKELQCKVDIPFDFVVSEVRLPAGHYAVYHFPTPTMILIENLDRPFHAFVPVNVYSGGLEKHPTSIVFHKYGNQYFLAEVRTSVDHQVHMAQMGREEQLLAGKRQPRQERILALK